MKDYSPCAGDPHAADYVFLRWGFTSCPIVSCKNDVRCLLEIASSLKSAFRGSLQAEKHWLHTHHRQLRGKPYVRLLQSRFEEVRRVTAVLPVVGKSGAAA